jgi:hypothetical protein
LACVSATRLHACSRIPGRDPILTAAMEQEEATRLAARMKWHIPRLAGFITVLLFAVGGLYQRGSELARVRLRSQAEDQADLAAANTR